MTRGWCFFLLLGLVLLPALLVVVWKKCKYPGCWDPRFQCSKCKVMAGSDVCIQSRHVYIMYIESQIRSTYLWVQTISVQLIGESTQGYSKSSWLSTADRIDTRVSVMINFWYGSSKKLGWHGWSKQIETIEKVKVVASTHPSCLACLCFVARCQSLKPLCLGECHEDVTPVITVKWDRNGLLSSIQNRQGAKSKSCFFFLDVGTCLCILFEASKAHHTPKCEDEIIFFLKSLFQMWRCYPLVGESDDNKSNHRNSEVILYVMYGQEFGMFNSLA